MIGDHEKQNVLCNKTGCVVSSLHGGSVWFNAAAAVSIERSAWKSKRMTPIYIERTMGYKDFDTVFGSASQHANFRNRIRGRI